MTRQGLSFEDEERIEDESVECVLRQMLFLRLGFFRDAPWRRFEAGLMLTHSGHLMNPDTQVVIWGRPGRPKPSCPCELEGIRNTGRTHNALSRHAPPEENQEEEGEEAQRRPRDRGCTWPPMSLRVPDVLYRRQHLVPRNQCYICEGIGHHGYRCPWLWCWFYVTPEGINMLARQGLEVPDEAKEATKAHAAVQEGPDVPRAIGGSTLPCPTYP